MSYMRLDIYVSAAGQISQQVNLWDETRIRPKVESGYTADHMDADNAYEHGVWCIRKSLILVTLSGCCFLKL